MFYLQFNVVVRDDRKTNQKSDTAVVTIDVLRLRGPPKFSSDRYEVFIPITTRVDAIVFSDISVTDDSLQVHKHLYCKNPSGV